MENQPPTFTSQYEPGITPLTLTERHLKQWIEMLAYLLQTQAPADEVEFCQSRIKQLEEDLQQLGNS